MRRSLACIGCVARHELLEFLLRILVYQLRKRLFGPGVPHQHAVFDPRGLVPGVHDLDFGREPG